MVKGGSFNGSSNFGSHGNPNSGQNAHGSPGSNFGSPSNFSGNGSNFNGTAQITDAERMARLLEAEPQVMDGVVVCMEFKEVVDLPDDMDRHQKLLLSIRPEDDDTIELGRIGPYTSETQQDHRYSRVSCENTQVILPVRNNARLQGKSSRLRIFLSYLDLHGRDIEDVGATEPFVVSFEGSSAQRRGQEVKPVMQARQYKIMPLPSHQDRAREFALTTVHLSHRLIKEDSRFDGESADYAHDRGFQQRGVGSSFFISLDRISDLPSSPYGGSQEGHVVITVESADSKRRPIETIGPIQTSPQAGGHLHKVACNGKRIVLDDARVQIFVYYQLTSGTGDGSRKLIGHTMPIDLADEPQSYHPLCNDAGYQVGSSRLYLTHRRFQRGADGQMMIPSGQYGSGQAGPQGFVSMSKSTLGKWPQEATKHLESPDGLDSHWNFRSSDGHFHASEPLHTGLKLVAGSFHIPHPDKMQHGAWEKEFMCRGGHAVGIFELHEATLHALHANPAETVHRMAAAGAKSCQDTRLWAAEDPSSRAWRSLRDGLQIAGQDPGAGLVATLNAQGSKLGVAKSGNLVLWQVRKTPGSPVTGSHAKVVAHAGGSQQTSPGQYGGDKPVALSLEVLEGDLLVLGSGGVFHNLHDEEMCDLMEWTVSPMDAKQTWDEATDTLKGAGVCTHPGELAAALAKAAFCCSRDEQRNARYNQRLEARPIMGGVKDDITVVCAWLAKTFASKLRD